MLPTANAEMPRGKPHGFVKGGKSRLRRRELGHPIHVPKFVPDQECLDQQIGTRWTDCP
jgi:hypothetical protein